MVDFDEGLCGCLSDITSCLIACLVPGGVCGIQAKAVNKATGEGMLVPFIFPCFTGCIGAAFNRGKIRDKYHLEGNYITDCLLEMLCPLCAVTQEYREVNRREGKS